MGFPLRRLAAALLLAIAAVGLAAMIGGCGGSQKGEDVEGLLDRAFRHSIERADLKLDAQLTLEGLSGFERPVRLQASGPFIGGGRALPQLDVDVTLGAQGAGQTVQFGLLRTGSRAFVKFGGEFYEQPRTQVRRANRKLGSGDRGGHGSLRRLGLDPRRWVVGAKEEDSEEVAGVEAHHVSGRLDARKAFRDLSKLVARSASTVVGAPADAPDPLSSGEIDQLVKTVGAPSFDVYIGKRDEVIRRLSANLEVRVPEKARARLGGLEGGTLRFSIEFDHLGYEERVEAPAKARPIADLTNKLGGLSAFGGVGALGAQADEGGGQDGPPVTPRAPRGKATRPRSGGGGVEAFRRYSDCLDKAGFDDAKALSRCTKLLR